MKFKGEYNQGKKINGKVYDYKGNIILVVENGKEKELFINDVFQFVGKYFNGRRWNGKGLNYYGANIFDIKYGKGLGREYYYRNNRLLFEGEYLNGLRNGKGKEYYYNG